VAASSKGSGRNQEFYAESPNFECFQLKKQKNLNTQSLAINDTWSAKGYGEQPLFDAQTSTWDSCRVLWGYALRGALCPI